jgi:hypothetical protein
MPSQAKNKFDKHIVDCSESITMYVFLRDNSGYKANFNLRFVWIAAVSSLDLFISELIVEKLMVKYVNNAQFEPKLLAESVSFTSVLDLLDTDGTSSLVSFRDMFRRIVKYKTFQHPDKISDGLSYIWNENHKWKLIAEHSGMEPLNCKRTLENIVNRRNLIAHSADYNVTTDERSNVNVDDAQKVVSFISQIVQTIDVLVP